MSAPNICGLAPQLPKDITTVSDREYELDIPASLTPAPQGKYFWVHGGAAWEDGHTVVKVAYGLWGEESFGMGKGCSVAANGHPVMLFTTEHDVLVWHQTSNGSHEPIVDAKSDTLDVDALAAIALSLRRRPI